MQYVIRVCVHLGEHKHDVAQGECKETMDTMKNLVKEDVQRPPRLKVAVIVLAVEKT